MAEDCRVDSDEDEASVLGIYVWEGEEGIDSNDPVSSGSWPLT